MNLSRGKLLSRLQNMNGHRFEELVADIWEQRGWEANVTDSSGDDGIDIIVEKNSPFNPNQKHIIQAKCYSDTSVGGPDLRDFGGSMDLADADAGVFVTTSSFSSQAEDTADRLTANLNLVNGEQLCDIILKLESPQKILSDYIETTKSTEFHQEQQSRNGEASIVRGSVSSNPESNNSTGNTKRADSQLSDTPQLDKKPSIGDTFTAKIDRISGSGNGIIETTNSHINVGPVRKSAIRMEITAEMRSDVFAHCLTDEAREDNYETEFESLLKRKSTSARSSTDSSNSKRLTGGTESSSSTNSSSSSERLGEPSDNYWKWIK